MREIVQFSWGRSAKTRRGRRKGEIVSPRTANAYRRAMWAFGDNRPIESRAQPRGEEGGKRRRSDYLDGQSIGAECVHITDETGGAKGRRTPAIEGEGCSMAEKAGGLELSVSDEIRIFELAGADRLVDAHPIGGSFKDARSPTKRARTNGW